MKKICFLVNSINNAGGAERATSIIANGLSNNGFKVVILTIVGYEKPFFSLNKDIRVTPLFTKPGRSLYRTPIIIKKVRKYLKTEKVDTLIVVETMSVLFTLPAVQGIKIKHICWEHFNFKNDLGKSGRRFARQLAARYCHHVVTLTERDKQFWINGTKHKSQITTIPNPSSFSPQSLIKREDTKTVLAVGRLTNIKGFDLLLEAWAIVMHLHSEWRLIIVGDGEDKEVLNKIIIKNKLSDSVVLAGNTENIAEYYKIADILCLTSRFEGFPMVLLETLAFGLPVVSFDCDTGPAEILKGTESILVPPNDTKLLASSLIDLMKDKDKREIIKIKSIEKSKQYQPKIIIEQWIRLIEEQNS